MVLSSRPRRLARSRTPGFHPGNTGSNPVGVTSLPSGRPQHPAASPRAAVFLLGLHPIGWVIPADAGSRSRPPRRQQITLRRRFRLRNPQALQRKAATAAPPGEDRHILHCGVSRHIDEGPRMAGTKDLSEIVAALHAPGSPRRGKHPWLPRRTGRINRNRALTTQLGNAPSL